MKGLQVITRALQAGSIKGFQVVSYAPQSITYFSAMETQMPSDKKAIINNRIKGLVQNGIWNKLDVLYFFDVHTASAALINVKHPGQFNATNISCSHNPYGGYTGGDNARYINTNYNLSSSVPSSGKQYSLNSASIGIWNNNNDTNGIQGTLVGPSTYITPAYGSGIAIDINQANDGGVNRHTNNTTLGFYVGSRTSSNYIGVYQDGELVGSSDRVTTGMPNSNMYFLNLNTQLSYHTHCEERLAFIGGALTPTDVSVMYALFTGSMA